MPLTPQDVQNKRFTVVRFKSGYDEEEVDNFLDEIEEELRRLIAENTSLRQAVATSQAAPGQPASAPAAAPPPPPPPPPPSRPPAHEETGDAALKTLMLAQKTAEDAIAQAHAEAEAIMNSARLKASALEHEAQAAHNNRLAALEDDRKALEAEIVALRTFEREFRTRLRAYLESSINDLDARPSVEPSAPPRPAQRPQPTATPPQPAPSAAPSPTPSPAPPAAASGPGAPAFAAGPPPVAAPATPASSPAAAPATAGPGEPQPAAAPPSLAPAAAPRGPAADGPTPPASPRADAASGGADDARSALAAAAAAAASAVPSSPSGEQPHSAEEPTAELPRPGGPAASPSAVPGLAPAAPPPSVAPSFVSRPVPAETDEPPSGPPAQA